MSATANANGRAGYNKTKLFVLSVVALATAGCALT